MTLRDHYGEPMADRATSDHLWLLTTPRGPVRPHANGNATLETWLASLGYSPAPTAAPAVALEEPVKPRVRHDRSRARADSGLGLETLEVARRRLRVNNDRLRAAAIEAGLYDKPRCNRGPVVRLAPAQWDALAATLRRPARFAAGRETAANAARRLGLSRDHLLRMARGHGARWGLTPSQWDAIIAGRPRAPRPTIGANCEGARGAAKRLGVSRSVLMKHARHLDTAHGLTPAQWDAVASGIARKTATTAAAI